MVVLGGMEAEFDIYWKCTFILFTKNRKIKSWVPVVIKRRLVKKCKSNWSSNFQKIGQKIEMWSEKQTSNKYMFGNFLRMGEGLWDENFTHLITHSREKLDSWGLTEKKFLKITCALGFTLSLRVSHLFQRKARQKLVYIYSLRKAS